MNRSTQPVPHAVSIDGLARAVNCRNSAAPTLLRFCLCSAIRLILCSAFAANVCSAQYSSTESPAPSNTPSKVDEHWDALACRPRHCHLEFENEQIRVLRVTLDGDGAFAAQNA